jgi:hypothetical protein
MEAAESGSGFAGAELREQSRELAVFGVGDPPPALVTVMDDAPDNVRVTWHRAPYSLAELLTELRRIMTAYPQIHAGGPNHDGTGISLVTDDRSLLDAPDARAALQALYPVTIEHGGPVTAA